MVNKYDNYELKKVTSLENVPRTIKDGDGYIWDPSELPDKDFDDSKVPLNYRRLAIWMRSKLFGKDVRETIARLSEMFGLNFKELMESFESLDNRQDAVETYTAQSVAQMEADKNAVIANATVDSEVILARGGKATLGQRLDETGSDVSNLSEELSGRGFNLSSLVGEDRIITNAMFIEANASDKNTIYLEKGTYYIHETIRVGHRILEGNNSLIVARNCDAFHVDNGDWVEMVPRIQNLTLRYEGSGKHKGIIVSRGWWGGRARLDNIRINDFSIGVLGMGMYHSTLKDIWINGSDIGMVITNNLEMSNMNDVSQIDFRDCTYGMYLNETESMRVFSATFQECVYGLVIGDARYNVEFDNCYYELNEYNTALGTIDLETFELTEYSLSLGGVLGSGVNFSGATLDPITNPPYFFGENHKFMSRYGNYDTNRYPDNIDTLFASGIEYENILQDSWSFYKGPTDTGVTTNKLADTPYGVKKVAQIDGATGENIRVVANIMTPLVRGRTYLVKAKVWAPEAMILTFHFLNDNGETIDYGRSFTTVTGGWIDVSSMITIHDYSGGLGSSQHFMIRCLPISDPSKLLLTDMMVVDLTAIFGSGNTPGHYLSRSISKYFNWAPTGERVKIGYGSVVASSFTTTNRPKYPKKGEPGFDTTLSKPIWCSDEAVIDTAGEITSTAKWVDSSGATV